MTTRLMYKALATAALGIALSFFLAETTTASPTSSNTPGAVQLDPPAAPSNCRSRVFYNRFEHYYTNYVTWTDNSDNEDGFTIEAWRRNQSGEWVLDRTATQSANYTSCSLYGSYYNRNDVPQVKYRVRAFNTFGDSAWSNWAQ